jgi:hypothetical protein
LSESSVTPASAQVPADESAPVTLDFTSHALRVALSNREDISSLSKLDWDAPGVYVLIGKITWGGQTPVYVGKATSLRSRLLQHRSKPPIDWWRAVAIARDTTDGFHSAQIGYLEGRLASQLRSAARLEVAEGQKNIDRTLPDHQLIPLDAFVPTILAALRVAGLDISKTAEAKASDTESDTSAGKAHYGVSLSELVSAGSIKPGEKIFFEKGGVAGEAVVNAGGEVILDGVAFKTLSGAGSNLLDGKAVNGWDAWRLGQGGPSLAEVRDAFLKERSEAS